MGPNWLYFKIKPEITSVVVVKSMIILIMLENCAIVLYFKFILRALLYYILSLFSACDAVRNRRLVREVKLKKKTRGEKFFSNEFGFHSRIVSGSLRVKCTAVDWDEFSALVFLNCLWSVWNMFTGSSASCNIVSFFIGKLYN